ncbi:MAG: alpha/beta hydrolase, partial [Bacteroidales bacterium]|nr:alpha/beta hydrolase [Bacteroidales bacterium]
LLIYPAMRTTTYLPLIQLFALLILFSPSVNGKHDQNSYDSWENYKFVSNIPRNATDRFIIVSTRNFIPENGYDYLAGVHPNHAEFIFLVSKFEDSTFITPCNNVKEAIRVLDRGNDFLVYVHGHGKTFEENLGRGLEVIERYGINLIMFDWPTNCLFIRNSIINSKKVTENFAQVLHASHQTISQYFPQSTFSIIFHSMGNHLAKNLVEMGFTEKISPDIFDNLILNAAAVSQKGHSSWVEKLNIQKRLYIIYNDGDMALWTVKCFRLSKQLGTGVRLITAKNAVYLSFSNVATTEHNLFLGRNEVEKRDSRFYYLYSTLFRGLVIDLEDSFQLSEMLDGKVYNLL